MDAGLLPVKRLSEAKGRLAPRFDAAQRLELSRALLADALDRCEATDFLRWWVVTDDPEVSHEATARGFEVVRDPGGGLNGALAQGIGAAVAAGAGSVTVLPVDIPLATADDVRDLVDTGATSDVVLAPARVDGGTNALYLSPPDVIQPSFGPASLRVHIADAEKAKLRCSLLDLPGLALDVDTFEDLKLVRESDGPDGATVRLARGLLPPQEQSDQTEP